jgi:hypothetical protein
MHVCGQESRCGKVAGFRYVVLQLIHQKAQRKRDQPGCDTTMHHPLILYGLIVCTQHDTMSKTLWMFHASLNVGYDTSTAADTLLPCYWIRGVL